MAAATGYDAPTDDQLREYADQADYGRRMVEVFAVRVPGAAAGGGRPPPCCFVLLFGGVPPSSCALYSHRRWPGDAVSPQPCDTQGNLVLTGPDIAIPASSPIDFILHLHDGSQKFTSYEEDYEKCVEIHCDNISVNFNNYNRPILETINTPYGPVDVIFAILSNGVQGEVTVKLIRCDREDPTTIFGRIVTRSKLFDVGCVLFYNENDKNIRAGSEEPIPLARQVLAVPLHMPLSIELDLYCYSGDEIIRGSLEFEPAKEGQHMSRLAGLCGAVIEVAIAWSEYPW